MAAHHEAEHEGGKDGVPFEASASTFRTSRLTKTT
jgi:hypothetical protein